MRINIETALALFAVAVGLVVESYWSDSYPALFRLAGAVLVFCTVSAGISRLWLKVPAGRAFEAAFKAAGLGAGIIATAVAAFGLIPAGAIIEYGLLPAVYAAIAFGIPAIVSYVYIAEMRGENAASTIQIAAILAAAAMMALFFAAGSHALAGGGNLLEAIVSNGN